MPFVNTREEIGERATLDGLIDGTLEVLRDNSDVTLSNKDTALFKNHLGLKTIVLPKFKLIDGMIFTTSSDASFAYVPAAEIIVVRIHKTGGYAVSSVFCNCRNATVIDIPYITASSINLSMWEKCINLKTLIIRNTGLMKLSSTASFNNTPFASNGTGGTLYVPSALISSYQSATNWSTILGYANNRILQIEGSIYDGYYADGSPIE